MAKHNLSSSKQKDTAAISNFFDLAVSLLQKAVPYSWDINYLHKSFRIKEPAPDLAFLKLEGILQSDNTVKLSICLAKALSSDQFQVLQIWNYLSQLNGVEILPLVTSPDGYQELWLNYYITPDHLNYIQHTSLLQTLEKIESFAGFLKEAMQASMHPDVAKVMQSYEKSNFSFLKPLPGPGCFSPKLLQSLDRISPALLSGNPVMLQHRSIATLEYIAVALATKHWREGIHFGKLRYPQPYAILLNEVITMKGIPVFTLNQLADQYSTDNISTRYNNLYHIGLAAIFLSDAAGCSYPDCFNVYSMEQAISLKQIIFHYLYQYSSTLPINRLQQLAEEAGDIAQPFYSDNETKLEAFMPNLCRQVLRIDQHAPHKLKAHLQAILFHHFE